jgi:hypothetical protein
VWVEKAIDTKYCTLSPQEGAPLLLPVHRPTQEDSQGRLFGFLFSPFFVLDVYDGAGDRIHIDLGDVF